MSWSFTTSQSSLGDAFANAHTYVDSFGNVMEFLNPISIRCVREGSLKKMSQVQFAVQVNNVENEAVSWIRLSDYRILTNGLITFTTDKVPPLLQLEIKT